MATNETVASVVEKVMSKRKTLPDSFDDLDASLKAVIQAIAQRDNLTPQGTLNAIRAVANDKLSTGSGDFDAALIAAQARNR